MTAGLLLLILGIGLLLEAVFGLLAPVFPVILGLILCWLGARLISSKVKGPGADEQNFVFRRGSVDLASEDRERVTVNVVFGICHVIPPAHRPVRVDLSCMFGQVPLPDGTSNVVGRRRFHLGEGENPLKLQVNVVCGILRFADRPAEPALRLLAKKPAESLDQGQVLGRLSDVVDT